MFAGGEMFAGEEGFVGSLGGMMEALSLVEVADRSLAKTMVVRRCFLQLLRLDCAHVGDGDVACQTMRQGNRRYCRDYVAAILVSNIESGL